MCRPRGVCNGDTDPGQVTASHPTNSLTSQETVQTSSGTTVNLHRDPRRGRTEEAFGEDPYLAGQVAGAFSGGPPLALQHFAQRLSGNTIRPAADPLFQGGGDRRALRAEQCRAEPARRLLERVRHGPACVLREAVQSLIENAHVAGLMTSYNAINGTPAVADTYTANQIAQRTFGFGGYVTSDCGAVGTTYDNPPSGHDWAPPGWTTNNGGSNAVSTNTATGATISGQAGGQAYRCAPAPTSTAAAPRTPHANIQAAINAGILSEGVIDQALTRVFTIRMETGEIDPRAAFPTPASRRRRSRAPRTRHWPPRSPTTRWSCSRMPTSARPVSRCCRPTRRS